MAFIKYLVDLDLNKNQLLNAVVQNLAAAPASPSDGQIYWDTVLDSLFVYNLTGATWIDLGSDGITNLAYTASATNGVVTSDSGTDATITLATGVNAGLLAPADKTKIDATSGTNTGDNAVNSNYSGLVSNVSTNLSEGTSTTTTVDVNSSDGTNATLASATTVRAGLLSKAKFDEIATNTTKVSDINHNVTTNLGTTTTTTTVTITSSDGTNAIIPQAVAGGQAGVTSGADKTKIDNAVLTSDTATTGMGFVIDEDNMISNSSSKLPTQQSVKAYVDNLLASNDAMVFKGTVGVGGTHTIAAFDLLVVYEAGWTYRVITAGTIKGVVAEIGDLFMATVDRASLGVDADWTVVQTNLDGAVVGPASAVTNRVATFNGTSGKLIQDSGLLLSGSNTGDEPAASTTVAGIIELATITETNTGTSVTRAVTPDGLDSWTGSAQITTLGTVGTGTWNGGVIAEAYLQNQSGTNTGDELAASATVSGVVELATNAETATGTDTVRAVTPAGLASLSYSTTTGTVKKTQVDCAAALSTTVTHALGQYIDVNVYRKLTPFDKVVAQVTSTNATTVVVTFNVAPTLGEYVIVVQG